MKRASGVHHLEPRYSGAQYPRAADRTTGLIVCSLVNSDPASFLSTRVDALVVGGGFYGARLALMLRASGRSVLLVEREPVLLGRASLVNQARVHNGYHYPRSILTSLRSRMNYSRFLGEYGACADRSLPHYYAVARGMSKITASQFAEFCRRIEGPATPASREISAALA